MSPIVRFIYDFVLLFMLFYLIYEVFLNKRKKDYSKLKRNDPVKIFITRYDLDMRKTDYKKVLRICALINSFIIAFTSALIININGFMYKLLITFITVFAFMYALYELAGKSMKRKEKEKKKNV